MARFALLTIILLSCFSFLFAQDTTDDPPWDVAPWPLENHRPQPEYPVVMKNAGIWGEFEVQVSIDMEGNISNIEILKERPQNLMNESVLSALQAWRFEPALRNGEPIESEVTMMFRFGFIRPRIIPEIVGDSSAVWLVKGGIASGIVASDSTIMYRSKDNGSLVTYVPPPIVSLEPHVPIQYVR
ncbi:energy transducer TonB [bacterium]|nr:energy transducer TonB [bacterium]